MERLLKKPFTCATAEETIKLGTEFATKMPRNSSIALIGDLGSGKTTFVKGLAIGFGITEVVNSPSFNILNIFFGNVTLLHIDAYRLDGTKEAADGLMLDDFLIPPYCLVVEWPENLYNFQKNCDFEISFKISGDATSREIRISHSK